MRDKKIYEKEVEETVEKMDQLISLEISSEQHLFKF